MYKARASPHASLCIISSWKQELALQRRALLYMTNEQCRICASAEVKPRTTTKTSSVAILPLRGKTPRTHQGPLNQEPGGMPEFAGEGRDLNQPIGPPANSGVSPWGRYQRLLSMSCSRALPRNVEICISRRFHVENVRTLYLIEYTKCCFQLLGNSCSF